MRTLKLSQRARADLDRIFDYSLETFGFQQASKYRDGLSATFAQMLTGEQRGRAVDDVRPDLLRANYVSHAIFFRREGDDILVVRVLHQSQDFKRQI